MVNEPWRKQDGMLTRDDMMTLLVAACPSYRPRWRAYIADPIYDRELVYVHLGDFADHLLDLMQRGSVEELPAVFAAVETLFRDGDDYVQEAAAVGLLEGIWFIGGNTDRRPQRFADCLGPEARKAWADAEGFWWDSDDIADLSPNVRNWLAGRFQ